MKIRIKKSLEIRKEPSLTADSFMTLAPDSLVTVDRSLYSGDELDGSDQWYRDQDGNYYPQSFVEVENEGVEEGSLDISHDIVFPNVDHHAELVSLYENLNGFTGKDVKIGIIDSGVYADHPNLTSKFGNTATSSYLFNSSNSQSTNDKVGHGTFISGIVAANTNDGQGIQGIAPSAEIYLAKIYNDDNSFNAQNISDALSWLIDKGVHIINMSFNTNYIVYQQYKSKIDDAINSGILCVAAAGNDDTLFLDGVLYPSMHDEVIAIGAISNWKDKTVNSNVNFMTPNCKVTSCSLASNDLFTQENGSSISTAYISGVIALLIEKEPVSSKQDAIDKLQELSSKYSNANNFSKLNIIMP